MVAVLGLAACAEIGQNVGNRLMRTLRGSHDNRRIVSVRIYHVLVIPLPRIDLRFEKLNENRRIEFGTIGRPNCEVIYRVWDGDPFLIYFDRRCVGWFLLRDQSPHEGKNTDESKESG